MDEHVSYENFFPQMVKFTKDFLGKVPNQMGLLANFLKNDFYFSWISWFSLRGRSLDSPSSQKLSLWTKRNASSQVVFSDDLWHIQEQRALLFYPPGNRSKRWLSPSRAGIWTRSPGGWSPSRISPRCQTWLWMNRMERFEALWPMNRARCANCRGKRGGRGCILDWFKTNKTPQKTVGQ